MKRASSLICLAMLAGCTPGGDGDAPVPTGSSTIAARGQQVFTVSAWDQTLSMFDQQTGETAEMELSGKPTRIARVGEDELWVTLRGARAVAVLTLDESGLPTETARIATGPEPHGIVASADGSRVYVAVSQADEVVEIDAATRDVLRTWKVQDDPRWLALHPSGKALFVVSAFDADIVRIDLEEGTLSTIPAPDTWRPSDEDPFSDDEVELDPRPTGDPAISPFGDTLVVPVIYADTTTPVEQPDDTEPPASGGGYSSGGASLGGRIGIGRLNPTVVGVPLDPQDGGEGDGPVIAFFVSGADHDGTHRGYISSATFSTDGTKVYATMESADAVAVVDLRPQEGQGMEPSVSNEFTTMSGSGFHFPADGGFYERRQRFVETEGNPSGIAMDGGGNLWVHERGHRSISSIPTAKIEALLDGDEDVQDGLRARRIAARHVVGKSWLDDDVEAGRRLFFSATDRRMAADGAGVSCGTCHMEGRNDGFTWTFEDGVRQTPSLAGPAALTAPVTWTLDVASVAHEAQITSSGRMGGQGLSDTEAARIEAFVAWQAGVDTPRKGEDSELVRLGEEVFGRAEVGCVECHGGEQRTDNDFHDMFGLKHVNTPTLVGVAATAPYLHDGSAPDLRTLMLRVRDGSMGDTSSLSDHELDALVAYLESL
ncbi:MAG: c-type cytochrome [Alphaproteobacteria bacterium]|nr:c-type cytochrome [Alphaproteobacteria bacterium]